MAATHRSNQPRDWLMPGSLSHPQLLHADDADRVLVCSPALGQGYLQEIPLRDDLMLVIVDNTFKQDMVIDAIGEGDRIEVEFHLAGPYAGYSLCVPCFRLRQFGVKLAPKHIFKVEVFFKGPALVSYAQLFMDRLLPQAHHAAEGILQSIYRHLKGGPIATTAGMLHQIFAPAVSERRSKPLATTYDLSMEQLLPDALFNDSIALNYAMRRPITPAMRQVVEQILSCPYHGMARRTYLTRKALQLVDLRLNAILQSPLNECDVNCIYQAAALLRSQMTKPPSLESLARQVGTNRFKLTQGFHELYGTTPFGYLRNCRLTQARRLLMTSELSINEVAAAVGYTSRSRFATAFRQRIGINPKAFQLEATV